MVRVVDGQTALFELLMRRHNERVYRVARAILRDDAEAEDVMQQAYVNAYTHLRQFDRRASFATWLTRIAVHEALARARRRGRYVSMEPEDARPADALTPVRHHLAGSGDAGLRRRTARIPGSGHRPAARWRT